MKIVSYFYFGSRILRLMSPYMRGDDIQILQALLNMLPDDIIPSNLVLDGIFGPLTQSAVMNFQRYFDLVVDGIVGQETYLRLGHRIGKYAASEPVFSSRVLNEGDQGADVSVLQNRLTVYKKGYFNRMADGMFGGFTKDAVVRFQSDFPDLNPDGIAGPGTYENIFIWAPLGGRTLRSENRGLDVYWLQYYLYQLGYYQRMLNGYFDQHTEDAVEDFQRDAGITIDGIVGRQTYLALGTSISFPQQEYYYRVQSGDSVYTISLLFNKSMEDIIKLNQLTPPDYTIFTGQLLKIPVPLPFHIAVKGETMQDLAVRYSLSLQDIKKANNMVPEGYLLPEETIVLASYEVDLNGDMIFLEKTGENTDELKKLNLDSGSEETLLHLVGISTRSIFLSKDRQSLALFRDNGNQILIYELASETSRVLNLTTSAEYLDWSFDSNMLVVGNGIVIDAFDGQTLFTFAGLMPQWYTDNKTLLYAAEESSLRKVNIETGADELVLIVPDTNIWFFQLAAPVNKVIILGFVPPGRVTFSFWYNLTTDELIEFSSSDYFADWSRNYGTFLLIHRDFYGEFFPWFYEAVNNYDGFANFEGQEIYSKSLELNQDNFSPDDKEFFSVMSNPSRFYPIPVRGRDVYVKLSDSRLLNQITMERQIYSPVWL
ncbi:MAG: peptidoglycan-binding protein [Bacillota bacterium]|nr:peptidoglycan-binding protein [Bacillota bacterium]